MGRKSGMRTWQGGFRLAVAALALGAGGAEAKPEQCLGTGRSQFIIDETFVASYNQEGFENQLKLSLCMPLFDRPGILFDYASIDIGTINYLSPVYMQQALYASIVPLSFLQLRAEAAPLVIWPLPFTEGAGYFSFPGYTTRYTGVDLPISAAKAAVGVNVMVQAQLQGEVPLFGEHALIVTDALTADYWNVGDGSHYYNPKRDVVLARSDWVIKNYAQVMVRFKASQTVAVQVGVVDDFTFVPASGYRANILSGWISVPIRRDGSPRDIEPFVRLGAHTHHAYRTGFQALVGISLGWGKPAGLTLRKAE